jgi:predicted DNA-binding transcriptional regulator AlpA
MSTTVAAPIDLPILIGYPAIMRMLATSRKGVVKMIERRELPRPIRIGCRWKWRRQAVEDALKRLEERAAAEGDGNAA